MTTTYYDNGTISVTNASATATLSVPVPVVVDVQPGDLLAVGSGLAVIASINAPRTGLTLARAWPGSTAAGADFEIILLADSIRLSNQTAALLDAISQGPLSGRFGAGSAGAPGVASLTHTTSGLFFNADGVGLANNGVARLLPISGGLNLSGTVQANGSPVYTRATILGTVSQSGGVPTGAVIQRSIHATNGEFVRFADGTQICTRTITFDLAGATTQTFAMPATFSAVEGTAFGGGGGALRPSGGAGVADRHRAFISASISAASNSEWNFRVTEDLFPESEMANFTATLIALGRWFNP